MFGSSILDVAIGLALIFLLLSLIASGVREAVEAFVKSRSVELERGIQMLFDDKSGEGLTKAFYEHPLIYSLYNDKYQHVERRYRGRNLPSYIPSRNFAVALMDMVTRGVGADVYAAQHTAPRVTVAGMRASVHRIPNAFVQRAVLSAIDNAHGDIRAVQKNLEAWYDSAMDRVSGSYKRRTQLWLFAIGLGTAVVLNVNTITIADYLAHNEEARAALAQRAQNILDDPAYQALVADSAKLNRAATRAVYADLQSLSLPIGWDVPQPTTRDIPFYIRQIIGILLTAFAVMLGAPFWFDMLNKVMVIRSTVKPHEKSPEEGSEDRQPKGKRGTVVVNAGAGRMTPEPALATSRIDEPDDWGVGVALELPNEPNEWADGQEDGVL
jgi:hypothetical protein